MLKEQMGNSSTPDNEFNPEWDDDVRYWTYWNTRYMRKRLASPNVHVPNKIEGKVLRKLMSETGLSEKQLREQKKYRKMLSDAQRVPETAKRTQRQKAFDRIMKSVTRELKLAKEHPAVQAEYLKRVQQAKVSPYLTASTGVYLTTKERKAIKDYT